MGLPDRCDAQWFITTFCGGNPEGKKRGPNDSIWVRQFTVHPNLSVVCIFAPDVLSFSMSLSSVRV